jgi:glycosyltransferase involved in cell wall biosynthesis
MAQPEVWVAGFPSRYGGADTELDHAVDLFRSYEFSVNLVPMFGARAEMANSVLKRGCSIHSYQAGIFADKTVISYCNGQFLQRLPEICRHGRPRKVIWFNCMTWPFRAEMDAHRQGLIDIFGFQSRYQARILGPELNRIRPFKSFPYVPYFNMRRYRWSHRSFNGEYRVGRVSRDDAAKYSSDMWRIFDNIKVPSRLNKKVFILGYGPNAARKTGPAPPSLDWMTWNGNGIPMEKFFGIIDTLVHRTGGSRENYPRVIMEALAHGAVPIVENAYGLPEMVYHGETGFLANTSEEMSEYATLLAGNPGRHERMARWGREALESLAGNPERCIAAWRRVL